ncbi:peptidase MA family metallohydrolase [Salinithrix halophila]|uniref:Peptidase MA family metallohydrolase n=1 Tax=Salinithrix halophila TaxID=1485204 RepID=A0ABV8JAC1_9BACL
MIKAHESLVEKEITRLIKQKEDAVNHKDRRRFLEVIHPGMRTYIQEQKRWFDDAVRWIDRGSFRLKMISLIPGKEHQVRVWLEQQYSRKGKTTTVKFPLLFQETEKGWRDADLPFYHIARGDVLVHYSDERLKEQALISLEAADRAVHGLERQFGWHPAERLEVKLYHSPEVFRQSIKLSLPDWAGGWHEAGQSVKLIGTAAVTDRKLLSSGIVHEVTHQMISEMTGDNAAYWLQEGAAEYFQSHLLPGIRTEEEEAYVKPRWSLGRLETIHLESLPEKEAKAYYAECDQFFRFLMEQYGVEKVKQLFAVLELSPAVDRDSGEKLPLINRRTRSAIRKVYGKSLEQLERDWIRSLKEEGGARPKPSVDPSAD